MKWVIVALIAAVLLTGGAVALKRKLSKKEENNLDALQPVARDSLKRVLAIAEAQGLKILIGSTRRSADEQAAAVASGNSSTTNSWHTLGLAVDMYPYGPDGKPDMNGVHTELFRKMHEIAATQGWSNLAFNPDGSKRYITTNKGKVWDGGHAEFRQGMTFATAKTKYGNVA